MPTLRGWRFEILEYDDTELGGLKDGIAEITGRGVFARLKYESGVHRVQRVPATESQGRIHTSTVTVAVLPEAEEVDVQVDEGDLRIDVYRASGAGGQHVNKTESAVRITHLATGIVVAMQEEKSQHKNRAKAMKILRARLYEQQRAALHATRAADRKSQVGTGDRSRAHPHLQFPAGPRVRPPHQPDALQDRPRDGGRAGRVHRCADRRGPGRAAGGGGMKNLARAAGEACPRALDPGVEVRSTEGEGAANHPAASSYVPKEQCAVQRPSPSTLRVSTPGSSAGGMPLPLRGRG